VRLVPLEFRLCHFFLPSDSNPLPHPVHRERGPIATVFGLRQPGAERDPAPRPIDD